MKIGQGQEIKWEYYELLFQKDQELMEYGNLGELILQDDDDKQRLKGNLRLCPKITRSHINPENALKMRVNLATQVIKKIQ